MKDDRLRLVHIKEALDRTVEYCEIGRRAAVIRNLEIVGEAVKHLSPKLKHAHKDVPWKRIAGMRDKLIHGYFGVNVVLVWETVPQEVPKLLAKVESLLE